MGCGGSGGTTTTTGTTATSTSTTSTSTTSTSTTSTSSTSGSAYTIVDLGPGAANAINNSGVIAGNSASGACYWTSSHVLTQLAASGIAQGISSDGAVAGQISGGVASVWIGGTVTNLTNGSDATAINASHQALSGSGYYSSPTAAPVTLAGLSGADITLGLGINDAGLIVGSDQSAPQTTAAVYWTSPTAAPLALALPFGNIGAAEAVSSSGSIAGFAKDSGGTNVTHAVYWSSISSGGTDLGVLGVAGQNIATSQAYGVNASGTVVGFSSTSSGVVHAFVYTAGAMSDLNTLSNAASLGLTLTRANGVNNSGVICGDATTSTGATHAFVAIP